MSALLLLATAAWAQDAGPASVPAPPDRPPAFTTDGELRLLGSMYPDVVVDDEGTSTGGGFVLDSRLRGGLTWQRDAWKVGAELDLVEGQLAGDPWDLSGGVDARGRHELDALDDGLVELRRAYVEGRVGLVGIQAGLVTSHWGLGMVANDGAHDPWFGRADFGDRVLRLRLATRPLDGGQTPLTFVLAGDRVVEDDTAEWNPLEGGQAAWQGIGSVLWQGDQTVGLYGVYRNQTETDGERTTEVGVLDLYGDAPIALGAWTLRLAIEAAAIAGSTDRTQTYNAREGLSVSSGGVTGLATLSPEGDKLLCVLRGGWASGDGDPDDDGSHDFAFDRDFDAGMVLYDEVQGAIEAQTHAQLLDPGNSGGPPEGVDALVTEGAFRRAAFVQPLVGGKPLSWLDLRAGVAVSWATAPPSQAFLTYRNGGVPVNHLGQPTSGYALGTELDWAVKVGDVDMEVGRDALRPALLVQGGHLLAADNLGGGTVTLVTATGRLRW